MGLFTELKRRNVIRVGIAYAVGSWLLAQAADLALDVIGAPDIVLRSLVVVLALGFFPAVIFAWAFEMTPEGLRRESEVDRSQSIASHTGKKLNLVTIAMLIAAVGFVAVERYLPGRTAPAIAPPQAQSVPAGETQDAIAAAPAAVDKKSIAVLPFANRSNQQDDLFFTDGIHDDLLTQLAKIHDLNVISRTSVMEYRDTKKNLREIGAELNVGTILEGGIQKVGDRVRINAQLIEASTDKHLWAETFDRELTAENIFDIQSEIARKIVLAVAGELTPEEDQLLSEIPTKNLAAYEAYLRARDVYFGANYSRSQEFAAQPWLEKAIELDPNYGEAYAMLAGLYGQTYWRGIDTSEALLEKYRDTIDLALRLNPNSPSALRALANYHYRVGNDYRLSLTLLDQALEKAPGNVDLYADRGLSLRRLGRWQESIDSFRKALELDPGNRFYFSVLVETMVSVRDWQGVMEVTVPLEDADPNELDVQIQRAIAQLALTGDLKPMEQVFEIMNPADSTSYISYSARVHWLQRDVDATIEVLNNPVFTSTDASDFFSVNRDYQLANAYRLKGDSEKAQMYYQQVIATRDRVMDSARQVRFYGGSTIALSLAWLGRFDEAMDLLENLAIETPPERDAMMGNGIFAFRAMIRGLAGDQEGAVDDLQIALRVNNSFPITVWDLYYDPNWDFMRDNPRFVELATPANMIRTITP